MRKTIVLCIAVAAIVGGVLLCAATRPDSFRVARSTTVHAPPGKLHALIADLHQFNTWNPFTKGDPQARGEYEGPASGPGATYRFGGGQSGSGSLRVLDASPHLVRMELLMREPLEARNHVQFALQPRGEDTEVTWTMEGDTPFIAKVIHLFIDMDGMVGGQFEAGLADLKQRAERT